MNKMKRLLAFSAALSMLTAGVSAFAEYDPNKVVDTSIPYTTLSETEISEEAKAYDGETVSPIVNFAMIDGVKAKEVDGIMMMPLRSVAESLSYTVTWVAESRSVELTRGAHFITMSIDKDEYAFSRRAPQALGAAPTLVGDSTYVPMSFVEEILSGWYYANEDGTYKIVQPAIATITAIEEDGSILVEDALLGEVVVFIGEETKITKGLDRRIYGIDDLKVGMTVELEYADWMTLSLPPQNTPVRINITDNELNFDVEEETKEEFITIEGTISEIRDEIVIVKTNEEDHGIALVVSDETVITKGMEKRIYKLDDLEVGMKISAKHGQAMTHSLPPQTAAIEIAILG